MAKYRVKEKSFIGHSIVEEGTIVEYDGVPGNNLEPLDVPAAQALVDAVGANKESLERQRQAAAGIDIPAQEAAAAEEAATLERAKALAGSAGADNLV